MEVDKKMCDKWVNTMNNDTKLGAKKNNYQ